MQALVKYNPSFATVFVDLQGDDEVIAEAGAMVGMTTSTQMNATPRGGGLFSALLLRLFGGESLYVNRFRAPAGGQVVLAGTTPGDVVRIDLNGTAINLETGSLLAAGPGVDVKARYAGLRHFIGREGLFKLVASGHGPIWLTAYGSVEVREVDGSVIVDTGHVLAFEPTLTQTLQLSGGIFSSMFGGEGLVSRFEGRGRIWIQSRNLSGLADWANSQFI